jgi:hypothetical protein
LVSLQLSESVIIWNSTLFIFSSFSIAVII